MFLHGAQQKGARQNPDTEMVDHQRDFFFARAGGAGGGRFVSSTFCTAGVSKTESEGSHSF